MAKKIHIIIGLKITEISHIKLGFFKKFSKITTSYITNYFYTK